MTTRLTPYGSVEYANNLSKVGKAKTPDSLASRMPSPEIIAKVGGKTITPGSLAARMPSPAIAAKVGTGGISNVRTCRVVRRNRRRTI